MLIEIIVIIVIIAILICVYYAFIKTHTSGGGESKNDDIKKFNNILQGLKLSENGYESDRAIWNQLDEILQNYKDFGNASNEEGYSLMDLYDVEYKIFKNQYQCTGTGQTIKCRTQYDIPYELLNNALEIVHDIFENLQDGNKYPHKCFYKYYHDFENEKYRKKFFENADNMYLVEDEGYEDYGLDENQIQNVIISWQLCLQLLKFLHEKSFSNMNHHF